jgi:hypothetical protein
MRHDETPLATTPPALDALLAHKQSTLEAARRGGLGDGLFKGTVGAVVGFAGGVGTITGVFIKRIYALARERIGIDPARFQNRAVFDREVENLAVTLLKEETLAGSMARNPMSFILGGAALGGAAGVAWSQRQKQLSVKDLAEDVDTLKHIGRSWEERASAPATEEKAPAR